jgi:hypothetical protein
MTARGAQALAGLGVLSVVIAACGPPGAAPTDPTWADVAPVVRGECVGCHGWTASDRPADPTTGIHPPNTGGSVRLDFFDVTSATCGDAALAVDPTVTFAGSPGEAAQIANDVVPGPGARWPRMPLQPSPALPNFEVDTLTRWAADPVKGPPPPTNRPPTIDVSQMPATADTQLAFTAVTDDPDGDSVLGVIEVGDLTFLMNRPGSFAVAFDTSGFPSGVVHPTAVLCDGWVSRMVDLGPVQIQH